MPEPEWAAAIDHAIGDADRVVNVGAGTGNYEPAKPIVVAVEPSLQMLKQRSRGNAVRGVAEALPFPDGSFDVAMGVLTVHHWTDQAMGLREMRRVADRQVLFIFEPLAEQNFWLTDYFETTGDTEHLAPTVADIARHLDVVDVQPLLVPAACRDGVAAAYWNRPEHYLRPEVQQSTSYLALMNRDVRERGIAALRHDLVTGRWDELHGHLRAATMGDYGYRLVIAEE